MVPIVIPLTVLDGGPRGIEIGEGEVAVWIRIGMAFELGQRDRLDDRESFGCAVFQIASRILAIEPVKEFPSGVAQIIEGLAVGAYQESLVVADLERVGEVLLTRNPLCLATPTSRTSA